MRADSRNGSKGHQVNRLYLKGEGAGLQGRSASRIYCLREKKQGKKSPPGYQILQIPHNIPHLQGSNNNKPSH